MFVFFFKIFSSICHCRKRKGKKTERRKWTKRNGCCYIGHTAALMMYCIHSTVGVFLLELICLCVSAED